MTDIKQQFVQMRIVLLRARATSQDITFPRICKDVVVLELSLNLQGHEREAVGVRVSPFFASCNHSTLKQQKKQKLKHHEHLTFTVMIAFFLLLTSNTFDSFNRIRLTRRRTFLLNSRKLVLLLNNDNLLVLQLSGVDWLVFAHTDVLDNKSIIYTQRTGHVVNWICTWKTPWNRKSSIGDKRKLTVIRGRKKAFFGSN